MKYLPILGELLSSDSVLFALIGFVTALVIGFKLHSAKKILLGFGSCLACYALAELLSNIRSSYLWELILLFVGTIAIGGAVGFLCGLPVAKVRKCK